MKLDKVFWTRAAWVTPIVLLATIWVMSRVGSVLPKILGDELIYSMDARKLAPAAAAVPNYFFNFVFSSTNFCGYGFYSCAKGLNLLFLIGLGIVVYLTSRLFAKPGISFYLALIIFVGPISSYVSYFSPDLMFFFATSIILYFLIKQDSNSKSLRWILLGLGVGVDALIKPHALFLILPLAAYIIYLARREKGIDLGWAALRILIALGATFAIKLGVGLAIAGSRGLGLFGGSYDAAATQSLSGSSAGVGQTTSWSFANLSWVGPFGLELTFHIAFLVIFFGTPLATLAMGRVRLNQKIRFHDTYSRLRLLSAAVTITMVLVSAIYVVISAGWGETLDYRVMVRYYEYALIFLPILLLPTLKAENQIGKFRSWALVIFPVLILAIALPFMSTKLPPLFTDSALIASVLKSGLTLYTFAVISLAFLIYLIVKPEKGAKAWLFGYLPIIVLTFAISSYVNMTIPSSHVGMYTHSSRWTHDNLTDAQKHNLKIYGNVKQNVQAAQLWVDDPSVTGEALSPGSTIDLSLLPNNSYVLIIGDLKASGTARIVHREQSFVVVQIQH